MAITSLLTPITKGKSPQVHRSIARRYRRSWVYKDEEERYFIGTLRPIDIPQHPSDKMYIVEYGDVARPDLIAYKHYSDPNLYWVILMINNISDPFEGIFPGMMIRIPSLFRLGEYGVLGV